MTFLVVDDRPDNAQTLCAALVAMGHAATAVHAVDKAVERCRVLRYDVLILDWVMPVGGGRAVIDGLDHAGARPNVILVLTGYDESVEAEVDALGLTRLRKPVPAEDIVAIARRMLGKA